MIMESHLINLQNFFPNERDGMGEFGDGHDTLLRKQASALLPGDALPRVVAFPVRKVVAREKA